MKNGRLQCKDIPDLPILRFVASHGDKWCNWCFENERDVRRSMPLGFDTPGSLVVAKMAGLIRRGLLDGCGCGCRGDYVITDKGAAFIDATRR